MLKIKKWDTDSVGEVGVISFISRSRSGLEAHCGKEWPLQRGLGAGGR